MKLRQARKIAKKYVGVRIQPTVNPETARRAARRLLKSWRSRCRLHPLGGRGLDERGANDWFRMRALHRIESKRKLRRLIRLMGHRQQIIAAAACNF